MLEELLFTLPKDAREYLGKVLAYKYQERQLEKFETMRVALETTRELATSHFDASGPAVEIGRREELVNDQAELVDRALKAFIPWKKGPFKFFGTYIDSEWRSDLKWERLLNFLPELQYKRIADVGCNNGYYMLRMTEHRPKFVLGFEPVLRHWLAFDLLNTHARQQQLVFSPFGVETIDLFQRSFDVIFCLGILYHHRDPITLLAKMHHALDRKGSLIIDCQGIPGVESVALLPKTRYLGASGMWFLPTLSCLENWVRRAGFSSFTPFFDAPLSADEQRATQWAPIPSFAAFIDPNDPDSTIEGYPAPRRFYARAEK